MLRATPESAEIPDWVADAVYKLWEELRQFFRAAWSISRRPAGFADNWAQGGMVSLNPLGFLATSLAFLGVLLQSIRPLLGSSNDDRLWIQLLDFLSPYLYYILLGLAAHMALRLSGSRRPLRGSVAIALYVGGGPAAALTVLTLGMAVLALALGAEHEAVFRTIPGWSRWLVTSVFLGGFVAVQLVLARALKGLHAVSFARSIMALMVALVAVGLFTGACHYVWHIPTNFGFPHLVVWPPHFLVWY